MKKYIFILLIFSQAQRISAQQVGTDPMQGSTQNFTKTYPVLWQQTSAEYRALCYQAFNIATERINKMCKRKIRKQKFAIVTDLDETILDNSYSEAQLIKDGLQYSNEKWKDWTDKSAATAVPGAVAFLQAAKNRGISIFYISNRDTAALQTTLLNLQKLALPDADTAHMLFLNNTSSKEVRRQRVSAKHNIVMLLGDNLSDFTSAFEKKSINERFTQTDLVQSDWGRKFIVLPNSTYGDWESALYNNQKNLTTEQKAAMREQLLKGFK